MKTLLVFQVDFLMSLGTGLAKKLPPAPGTLAAAEQG